MICYTQFSASQEVPPPYYFPNVQVKAFVWEAKMGPVQAYCDKYFNLGAAKDRGFVYRPVAAWPYIVLLFLDYPVMMSSSRERKDIIGGEKPYQDRGVISQKEVFLAVPVIRYGASALRFASRSALEWALPFIVVENPMSATCGREMLGMGKLLAEIKMDQGDFPDSFEGSVRLPGWQTLPGSKQRDPGAKQKTLDFLRVTTAPVLPTFRGQLPQTSLWSLFQSREAGWGFDSVASAANFADDASFGLAPTVMRTVALKQFRDALRPDEALYQALVTCRSHYDYVREFRFYNELDVEIEFPNLNSFSDLLLEYLKIDPDRALKIERARALKIDPAKQAAKVDPEKPLVAPLAAFSFLADIDFDEMHTIHTYPVDRPGLAPVLARSDLAAPWLRPFERFFLPTSS